MPSRMHTSIVSINSSTVLCRQITLQISLCLILAHFISSITVAFFFTLVLVKQVIIVYFRFPYCGPFPYCLRFFAACDAAVTRRPHDSSVNIPTRGLGRLRKPQSICSQGSSITTFPYF